MRRTTEQDSLRDRARDYRRAGEVAHAARKFRLRNKMFRLHDNIMLRIYLGQSVGPIREDTGAVIAKR